MKTKFHVGQRFDELEVIAVNNRMATLRCSCGVEFTKQFSSIVKKDGGTRETCGATACRIALRENRMSERDAALIGNRFGALLVESIYRKSKVFRKSEKVVSSAVTRCDCGKVFEVDVSRLVAGEVRNCGCGKIRIDPAWELALYTRWAA